jgi:hypothetical protein
MRRVLLGIVLVGGAGLGCGGGGGSGTSGGALDCSWLGGDNCWKTTVEAAASCLPAESSKGTFSADDKSCSYATGETVTFASAVALPLSLNSTPTWDFTVSKGGAECLRYQATQTSKTLVVMGHQTVTQKVVGLTGWAITCPDGTTVSSSNFFDLLNCDADGGGLFGGGDIPGETWGDTPNSLSFSFTGTASGATPVFSCMK